MIAAIPYNIYRQKTPLFSLTSSISFQILFFNKKTAGNQNKRMNGYSLIAIQLFGEFVNGI